MISSAHVDEIVHDKVVEVDLHGRLTRADYDRFVPETERMIRKYGKIRMLVTLHDFYGWDAGALWEDLKWNARHLRQVERLAIVGNKSREEGYASGAFDIDLDGSFRWHKWLTRLGQPFTHTAVRYFTFEELDAAHAWLNER